MRILSYIYIFGMIGVILAYTALHINILWVFGYLLVLFFANLVPKKLKAEIIVAVILLGVTIAATSIGQSAISDIAGAFLLLATGLPGALIYSGVMIGLHSNAQIQAITLVSESTLVIILVLQVLRFVLTKVFFVSFWIPIVNIIPILVDTAIIVAITYLVIGTGNGSVLYNVIQKAVNSVL